MISRSRRLRLLSAVAVIALLAGCSQNEEEPLPRGVVLVSIDELRADRLEPYGGAIRWDALAEDRVHGTWFQDLVAVAPTPRAAAATLLTGLTPDRHGVHDDVLDRYGGAIESVPERLSRAGWKTAAFVQSPILGYGTGFEGCFDAFDGPTLEMFGPGGYFPIAREVDDGLANLELWLGELADDDRFFAWVQLAELYGAVAGTPIAEDPAPAYDEAVGRIGPALERIVSALEGVSGPVDLIVVGSYGTHVGVDGAPRGSAFWLDRDTLHVPGFLGTVGAIGIERAALDDVPRWLPDVAATVLDRAGVDFGGTDGVPLVKPILPGSRSPRRAWTWAPYFRVGWNAETRELQEGAWVATGAEVDVPTWRVSDEARERLAVLGIGLGPANVIRTIDDPVARNSFLARTEIARFGFGNNHQRRAGRQSHWLSRNYPDQLAALHIDLFLTTVFRDSKVMEARLASLYADYPERPETLHWGAHAELTIERPERARALLEIAHSVGIADGDVEYDLACLASLAGDVDLALGHLETAVDKGFRLWNWIERDPELANLRSTPQFAEFMASRR